jgi:hypothetical protein
VEGLDVVKIGQRESIAKMFKYQDNHKYKLSKILIKYKLSAGRDFIEPDIQKGSHQQF